MPLNTLQRVDLVKYSAVFNGVDAPPHLTSGSSTAGSCAQLLAKRKASSFLPAQNGSTTSDVDACQNLFTQHRAHRPSVLTLPFRRRVGSHFLGGHGASTSFAGPGLDMPAMSPGMGQAMPGQMPSPGMPGGGGPGGFGSPTPTGAPDPFGSSQASPFGSQNVAGQPGNSPLGGANPAAGPMQPQNPQMAQQPMGSQQGFQNQQQMGQPMQQQQQPGGYGPTQQYGAQPQQQPYGQTGQLMDGGQGGVHPPGTSGGTGTGESKELSSAGEGAPMNPASLLVPLLVIGVFGGLIMFLCNRNKQPKTDLGGDSASAISDDEESGHSEDSSSDDKS
mmetsp:Transcript_58720/g.108328  ORF Transcript_58720/g.108328 Transcript_58720/m.108328 type:complete len:333 (-) Transcript_58720:81-1079(-)